MSKEISGRCLTFKNFAAYSLKAFDLVIDTTMRVCNAVGTFFNENLLIMKVQLLW